MAIYLSLPAELAAVSTGHNEPLPCHGHLTHRMPPRAPVPATTRRLCAPPSLSTFFHLFEASHISTVRYVTGQGGGMPVVSATWEIEGHLSPGVTSLRSRTKLYLKKYIYSRAY